MSRRSSSLLHPDAWQVPVLSSAHPNSALPVPSMPVHFTSAPPSLLAPPLLSAARHSRRWWRWAQTPGLKGLRPPSAHRQRRLGIDSRPACLAGSPLAQQHAGQGCAPLQRARLRATCACAPTSASASWAWRTACSASVSMNRTGCVSSRSCTAAAAGGGPSGWRARLAALQEAGPATRLRAACRGASQR